jgi:hypothetical protein
LPDANELVLAWRVASEGGGKMRRLSFALFISIAALLGACADAEEEILVPMADAKIIPSARVVDFTVNVSRDLSVSEARLYYPISDINWREDPKGDRYVQVGAIITRAARWGLSAFDHGRDIEVTIDMLRFHALSQKARREIGGIHSIRFNLTVTDANTGAILMGPDKVVADLQAFGGYEAETAVAAGLTQKVRIVQHVAGTLQLHLVTGGFGTLPELIAEKSNGF